MNEAIEAKKLAIVITITSRFWTWVSSWPSTASSSAGSSSWSMPVVAHTVAVFGERPTANAFGIGVSAIATRGLGMFAWMHSRSMIACSSGRLLRGDLAGAHRGSAILSEVNSWTANRRAGDHRDRDRAGAGGDQHGDQDGIDEPSRKSVSSIRVWSPRSRPNDLGRPCGPNVGRPGKRD